MSFLAPKPPKMPTPVAPPPVPTVDDAAARADDEMRRRRRRGRAPFVLAGRSSLGQPQVGTKTLTGS